MKICTINFFSSILSFIDKGRTGCHRGEVFNNFPKKLSLFEMENALNKPPLFLPALACLIKAILQKFHKLQNGIYLTGQAGRKGGGLIKRFFVPQK
jgi:hypothetical protein